MIPSFMPGRASPLVFATLVVLACASTQAIASPPLATTPGELLTPRDKVEVARLFGQLVEAENRHDLTAVRALIWNSPSTLFVAKTGVTAQGGWAGFWGTEVVMAHFHDLYQGAFQIDVDPARVRLTGLSTDVAEIYAPVDVTVAYGGQTPVPKPFLLILDWVRTPEGWRMATDIAVPIPTGPTSVAAPQPAVKP